MRRAGSADEHIPEPPKKEPASYREHLHDKCDAECSEHYAGEYQILEY